MPWKETNVMNERLEFVLKSLENGTNFTVLCREYGISTKCGYKWKERFMQEGINGLKDQKKTPNTSPSKLSEDMILELINLKVKKKFWGSKKILELYSLLHPNEKLPSRSSVDRIFSKAGLTEKKKRRKFQHPSERIQNPNKPTHPNHIWTVDFKGWWYTPEREKCNPLTVRDEFSKYILSIKALKKGDITSVKAEFIRLFKIYGLPEYIKSDNGPPFAASNSLMGLTKLSVWWVSLGIKLHRIDPGKPYQNGSHERMHRDMKRELESQIIGNLTLHQKMFDKWRKEYNTERPHEALKMKTPESIYVKSKFPYFENEDPHIEYPLSYKSRIVNSRGYINWSGHRIMIGNPFAGYRIGIKKDKMQNLVVWFTSLQIGFIDENSFLLISNADNNLISNAG